MDRIYIDFKDENIAKYILYADDTYLYVDAAKEKKATAEEVVDTFIKGVFVDVDGVKYIPVSIEHTDASDPDIAYETVTCVKADSSTPTTAVLFTVRSTDGPVTATSKKVKSKTKAKPKKGSAKKSR